MEISYKSELIRDLLYIVIKIRERQCKRQISAQAYPIYFITQQSTSYILPIALSLSCRVSALHECRSTAKSYREQIRMESYFMCFNRIHSGAEACLKSVKYTFDKSVKAKVLESFSPWFNAYPRIIVEHISLFAVAMNHINKLFSIINNEIIYEFHPVKLVCRCSHMSCMKLTLIYKIL